VLCGLAEVASPVDVAQALWAFEVLHFRRTAVTRRLAAAAVNQLHTFGPQALSNIAWAVASSGTRPPPGFPAAVAQQLQVLLPSLTPQGLTTTLWALNKLGHVPRQLLYAASASVLGQLHTFGAQDLCNLAMVCAKAGFREPVLLQGLADAAAAAAADALMAGAAAGAKMQPQWRQQQQQAEHLSWWDAPAASVLAGNRAAATAAGRPQTRQLTAQGVCNLAWAFAGMGWHDAVVMQQLQALALVHVASMQPRHIAGLCQSFGLLMAPLDPLLHALCSQRQQQQECPGSGPKPATAAAALAQGMQAWTRVLDSWPADSLALLVCAAVATQQLPGSSGPYTTLLLAGLQLLSRSGMGSSLSPARQQQLHHCVTLLSLQWGLAQALPGQALEGTAAAVRSQQASTGAAAFQPRQAVAAAQARVLDGGAWPHDNAHAAGEQLQQQLQPAGAAAVLALDALSHKLVRSFAHSWFVAERSRHGWAIEAEVVAALARMGLQPVMQQWLHLVPTPAVQQAPFGSTKGTPAPWRAMVVRVGLARGSLAADSPPVAVSVLPPSALSSSAPRRMLGQAVVQQACLSAAGWRVVIVAAEEWEALAGDWQQQVELLRRRLA
jgi:hypothetical protein